MGSIIKMKIPRKIAFYIPTLNIGGTEHSFVKLANAFVKKGEKVQLVLSRNEGALVKELVPGVELVDLGNLRLSTSFFALKAYIEREQPTHLITGSNLHNEFVVLVSMMSRYKTKVILTQRNFLDYEVKHIPIYRYCYKFLMKWLYPKAYKVVTVSKGIAFMMNDLMPHLSISQIYNPFDSEDIVKKSQLLLNHEASFNTEGDYILFVGRFVTVKNIDLLIKAFSDLHTSKPDLKLVMVGDGVLSGEIRERVKALNLSDRVEFLGSLPNAYALMKNARAVVLPSFSESLGGVLIEALALGTTVVTTPTSGAREVLSEGAYGYLSTDFVDAKAFANLIAKAIENPFDAEVLRLRSQDFDSDKISQQYLTILD